MYVTFTVSILALSCHNFVVHFNNAIHIVLYLPPRGPSRGVVIRLILFVSWCVQLVSCSCALLYCTWTAWVKQGEKRVLEVWCVQFFCRLGVGCTSDYSLLGALRLFCSRSCMHSFTLDISTWTRYICLANTPRTQSYTYLGKTHAGLFCLYIGSRHGCLEWLAVLLKSYYTLEQPYI